MKFVWVFMYVYIGVPFKNGGGGGGEGREVKLLFQECGFKKTSKITDDPGGSFHL